MDLLNYILFIIKLYYYYYILYTIYTIKLYSKLVCLLQSLSLSLIILLTEKWMS